MNYQIITLAAATSVLLGWGSVVLCFDRAEGRSVEADSVSPFSVVGGEKAFDASWEFKQLFQEGQLLHRQGQWARASALYNRAYNLDKGRIEVLPYWGLAEYRLGNCGQALHLYELYLMEEPQEELVLFNKAVCQGRLERWNEAAQTIDKLADSSLASSSEFLMLSGAVDYHRHNLNSAKSKLEKSRQLRQDNIGAALTLAAVYQEMAEPEQACQVLRESLQAQPENALLLNNLGVLNWHLGRATEAEDCFRRAEVKLNLACLNSAVCQVFTEGQNDVLELAELTDKFPSHPLVELLYGIALYRSARFSEARDSFIKVQELLYELSGDETISDGQEFIKGQEADRLAAVNKKYTALTSAALGQTASALACLQELYEANGADIDTCHNLAVLYSRTGNYRKALELACQARELVHHSLVDNPQKRSRYEQVYYCLAYLYDIVQDKEKAAQAYAEWKELFPANGKNGAAEAN
ncbi:MAG: tetratricopeptide repeat protein [Candidatus Bruticola sp.]